jgi:hypothetical protein
MQSDQLPNFEFKNDHDVLVAMYVEVKQLKTDVREMKDNTNGRVMELERDKANAKDLEELQKGYEKVQARVSSLENWRWYLLGAFAALVIVAELYDRFNH